MQAGLALNSTIKLSVAALQTAMKSRLGIILRLTRHARRCQGLACLFMESLQAAHKKDPGHQ